MSRPERGVKRRAVVICSIAGIICSLAFIFVNLDRGLPLEAAFDGLMVITFVANYLVYLRRGNAAWAGGVGLTVIMGFVLSSAESLGSAALVWVFIVPMPAFYFLGLRGGRAFVGFWCVVLLLLFAVFGVPGDLTSGQRIEVFIALVVACVIAHKLEQLHQEYIREARSLTVQAQQANEAKDRFLARMSHELRTPLNSIMGFAQVMSYREELPRDVLDNLGRIRASGNCLLEQVEALLDYSKLSADATEYRAEHLDVSSLIAETIEALELQSAEKDVVFGVAPTGPVSAWADARLLRRALKALLADAIRRSPASGRIEMEVDVKEKLRLRIRETAGCGIVGDRAGSDRTSEITDELDRGGGLGLMMVGQVAALHGGVLLFDERGSSITLVLPNVPTEVSTPE